MKTRRILPAFGLILFFLVSLVGPQKTVAQPGVDRPVDSFYDELEPYGEWVPNDQYGRVWMPDVEADFQPYATNGHWAVTEYGNTWVSDYDWGWAPFHYGRWVFDEYYGRWIWVPDSEWGPAWVSWRTGGGCYGWAPLGPGMGINVNINLNLPFNYWTFVPQMYFTQPRISSYCIPRARVVNVYHNTTIINNIYRYNNRSYGYGPRREEIERYTRRSVPVYRANDLAQRRNTGPRGGYNGSNRFDTRGSYNGAERNNGRSRGEIAGNYRNEDRSNRNSYPDRRGDNAMNRNDGFPNRSNTDSPNRPGFGNRSNSESTNRPDFGNRSNSESTNRPDFGNRPNSENMNRPDFGNRPNADNSPNGTARPERNDWNRSRSNRFENPGENRSNPWADNSPARERRSENRSYPQQDQPGRRESGSANRGFDGGSQRIERSRESFPQRSADQGSRSPSERQGGSSRGGGSRRGPQ